MDDFCLWAPWVFSALALTLGWLLRWWYDDRKFEELNDRIKEKESDVYHLNEAHNLLLKDKNKKISEFDDQMAIKERVIKELKTELGQTTNTTKNLLSQVVESKQKSSPNPVSIVSVIAEKAKKKQQLSASAPTKKSKKKSEPSQEVKAVSTFSSTEKPKKVSKTNSSVGKVIKKKSKASRIKKYKQIIKDLRAENERLHDKSDALETSRSKSAIVKDITPKTIVKEIPTTLTRTIVIKEKVDRKKLKKALKKVPFKKTKKLLSVELKKGKAKIVKS